MPMANRPWVLGMASFSSTEAAFEGFRLTREHPLAVLGWIAAYFAFSLALAVLAVVWGAGQDIAAMKALSQSANPDPAQMVQALQTLLPYVMVVIPLQIIFFAVLNCAIYRAVLRPYERGLGYLQLGSDEARMVVLFVVLFAIWLTLIFAVTLVTTMAAQTVAIFGGVPGALFGFLVGAGSLGLAVWVLVIRLSMAAPMTFAERRLVVFGSWSFTRGKSWPLIGAYVVAFALALVVIVLLVVLFSVALMIGGVTMETADGLGANAKDIGAFLTVPTVLAQLFSAVIIIVNYVLVLSPSAIAYRGLAGMETHPEVFA